MVDYRILVDNFCFDLVDSIILPKSVENNEYTSLIYLNKSTE